MCLLRVWCSLAVWPILFYFICEHNPLQGRFFHVIVQFFNQDIKNPEISGPDTPGKLPLITDPVVTWGCHMRFSFLLYVWHPSTWEHRLGCFCLDWNALLRTDQEQHKDKDQVMFWTVWCQVHVMRIYFCQRGSPILLLSGPGVSVQPAWWVTKCHWVSCPYLGQDPDFALWRSLEGGASGDWSLWLHATRVTAGHPTSLFFTLLFLYSTPEFIINYRNL